MRLDLRFLGGISVVLNDTQYSNQLPRKVVALLCYLSVTQEIQPRETLASLLWSDFPDNRARSNLRDALVTLRRTGLASYLDINRRTVAFNPNPLGILDSVEFLTRIDQAETLAANLETKEAAAALEAAVELYRGDFLSGFEVNKAALFDDWMTLQRQHLHRRFAEALEQLVEIHLETEEYEACSQFAHRALKLDPLNERSHRNLMLALFLKGEHNSALNRYDACRRILDEELGIAPAEETQILYRNIQKNLNHQSVSHSGIRNIEPAPKIPPVSHNLPNEMTPFFGREKEQRAIDIVFGDKTARLVTILGVGGSGKTRLARAIGAKQLEMITRDASFRFRDGVFFVPLEAVESSKEIIPAICKTLEFQPASKDKVGRSAEDQLIEHLKDKKLLLIIDNFEHLLDGTEQLVRILQSTGDVHLLITSRQRLGLSGERLFTLRGLNYPKNGKTGSDPDDLVNNFSAVALFDASARRMNSDFQIQDEDVRALVRICHLVEGLPLALELAAGWTDVLSVNDIALEIEKELSILESRLSDIPERHRNMEAVFDVTWRQLNPNEQAILAKLSVFQGGFTREAAVQVVGATLRHLGILVNKALIQYDEKRDSYQMHRLVRMFSESKLSQDSETEESIRDQHCAYYCDLLQDWGQKLKGTGQLATLSDFDRDHANTHLAWQRTIAAGRIDRIGPAAEGLLRLYFWRRRFHEGESAAHQAEQGILFALKKRNTTLDPALQKRTLVRIRIWRSIFSDREKAKQLIHESNRLLDHLEGVGLDIRNERAWAYQRAANFVFSEDPEEAQNLYLKSLNLYRDLQDLWGASKVLTELGWKAIHDGKADEAEELAREALSQVRATGDCKRTADILWLLGTLAILQGRVAESSSFLSESLEIREMLGDNITDIETGPLDLGMTLTWIGRFAEAEKIRREALAVYEAQGRPDQIAMARIRLATSKLHIGDFGSIARHTRSSLAYFRISGDHHGAGLANWLLGMLAMIEADDEKAESYIKESLLCLNLVARSPELGWVKCLFAELHQRRGRIDLARQYLSEALQDVSGVLGLMTILFGLHTYTNILISEGRLARAVEMVSLLQKHPLAAKSPAVPYIYGSDHREIRAILPLETIQQAEARGLARDFFETAEEILAELAEKVSA